MTDHRRVALEGRKYRFPWFYSGWGAGNATPLEVYSLTPIWWTPGMTIIQWLIESPLTVVVKSRFMYLNGGAVSRVLKRGSRASLLHRVTPSRDSCFDWVCVQHDWIRQIHTRNKLSRCFSLQKCRFKLRVCVCARECVCCTNSSRAVLKISRTVRNTCSVTWKFLWLR